MIWRRTACCKDEPEKRIGNGAFLCLCTQCCGVDLCAKYIGKSCGADYAKERAMASGGIQCVPDSVYHPSAPCAGV